MVEGQTTLQTSEKVLNASVKRQESLRSILWTNLLAQRATVFALESKLTGDSEFKERAIDVIKSVPSFFPEKESERTSEQKALLKQMESIEKNLVSATSQK